MAVGVRFLLGDLQAVAHVVEVVDVGEPYPGSGALGSHALLAVPLGLLPQVVGVFDVRLGQGLVEVSIYRGVLVAGEVAPAGGVVELVHLDGALEPQPHSTGHSYWCR